MKPKITLIFLGVLLIVTPFGKPNYAKVSAKVTNQKEQKIGIDFEKEIENNLKLTIYYIPPGVYTNRPYNNDDLIRKCDYKITVSDSKLRNHIDNLQKISKVKFKNTNTPPKVNVRVYCEFSTDSGKIFSFSLTYRNDYILLNDQPVEPKTLMYDFIIPFIPKEEVFYYKNNLGAMKSTQFWSKVFKSK